MMRSTRAAAAEETWDKMLSAMETPARTIAPKRRGSLADVGPSKKYKSISPRPAADFFFGALQRRLQLPQTSSWTGPTCCWPYREALATRPHFRLQACDTCRHKKVKCNWGIVSGTDRNLVATWTDQARRTNEKVAVLLERVARLEQSLESLRDEVRLRDYTAACDVSVHDAARAVARLYQTPPDTVLSAKSPLYSHGPVAIEAVESPLSLPPDFSTTTTTNPSRFASTTPFACEERRAPLPNLLALEAPTDADEIMAHVDSYLGQPYDLFPLMCKSSAYAVAVSVRKDGLQPNLQSCYALLMVALAKAYADPECVDSGLADFQMAGQIRGRLGEQLNLESVVVQFLITIFLLKKGLMINFALALHAACSSLYTLIKRDQASGIERDKSDRNTISSSFWIGHNLERDLVREIDDTFPQSSLHLLAEGFILPLGCDDSPSPSAPPIIRDEIMFFFAEMALRAVTARILTTPYWKIGGADRPEAGPPEISPLLPELRGQLDEWLLRMPASLDWSTEPVRGSNSPVVARLKILYWFARFSLARPLIVEALRNPAFSLPLQGWVLFQDGIMSAMKVLKVLLWEETELDFLMGNRYA
ncbi:c6 zinc finger domain containing protein [Grosmannia clavigera kw1407]|uniref:C6 zinc finger domain containing protein n=1 Tax=Grosmannia clavigera (strain kw1407 / UAMH 11150) TaxID=655863 RepID=F0XJS0_GROCL|nr:c6 zinc finger domain containing protein [Grosmannia clavigera kw1407]EFX02230.1 c6 zinc finger domain containing protein [Grosmannia clavigera kw1407]